MFLKRHNDVRSHRQIGKVEDATNIMAPSSSKILAVPRICQSR
jgi:hypothetical protein